MIVSPHGMRAANGCVTPLIEYRAMSEGRAAKCLATLIRIAIGQGKAKSFKRVSLKNRSNAFKRCLTTSVPSKE
jgi:hypothetical protein